MLFFNPIERYIKKLSQPKETEIAFFRTFTHYKPFSLSAQKAKKNESKSKYQI